MPIIYSPLEKELKQSYLEYALSVLVGRALPDVRDGLKPVHRRILYAMYESGIRSNKPYKKSARVVGDVLGKYHPHGDKAVYDALVRMAQPFVMNLPLVDGHGNFGSIDGDPPAAMRYTEVRLSKVAEEMLEDIDKETVDFVPNFDASLKEPVVLPSKFPNLLVNGSYGIAVGLATNVPPHNLGEVLDALVFIIDKKIKNEDFSPYEIFNYIKGPDFPTGGEIVGKEGIISLYTKGKGKIPVRGRAEVEKHKIIITEIPFMVNKASLLEEIAKLAKEEKIKGIKDIRDESDREGIRVVVEIKKEFNPEIVLNMLYKHTSLESSLNCSFVALVDNVPKQLTLVELLEHFLNHRVVVVERRTIYLLNKAKHRKKIIEGFLKVIDNIDLAIRLIKTSQTRDEAKNRLMENLSLDEEQAEEVLKMQLQRLVALERNRLLEEKKELEKKIKEYETILSSKENILKVVKEEFLNLKEKYSWKRKTKIVENVEDLSREETIQNLNNILVLTYDGFIYKSPYENMKEAKSKLRKVKHPIKRFLFAKSLDELIFVTNKGRIMRTKVYSLPEKEVFSKKIFSKLKDDEYIVGIVKTGRDLLILSKDGRIKRLNKKDIPSRGLIYSKDLEVVDVVEFSESFVLFGKNNFIVLKGTEIPVQGRTARGVKGIKTEKALKIEENTGNIAVVYPSGKIEFFKYVGMQNRGGVGKKTKEEIFSGCCFFKEPILQKQKDGKIISVVKDAFSNQ